MTVDATSISSVTAAEEGERKAVRTKRYLVTIEYREPTFERYAGIGPQLRKGTFVLFAETEEAAAIGAVYEFRRIEALSGVGWSRDVESVSVFPRVIEGGRR